MLSYKRKSLVEFKNRLIVAKEIKSVSHVLPIDGINYAEVAEKYKFEYFIHGDDWKSNIQSDSRSKLIEVMKSWGGVVIDVPYTKGISSTELNSKSNKVYKLASLCEKNNFPIKVFIGISMLVLIIALL